MASVVAAKTHPLSITFVTKRINLKHFLAAGRNGIIQMLVFHNGMKDIPYC